MATRVSESLTDRTSLTPEDFDEELKYTGFSVSLFGEPTRGKTQLVQMSTKAREKPVEYIPYASGSASGIEGETLAHDLGIYPKYKNVVSPKSTYDAIKPVKQCLDDSIELLDAVLDAYDEEVERETYLNLLKEKIEDLWEQRDKYNRDFKDVVVQLKVVSRILDYELLSKIQIQSIKEVLSLLKKINITKEDRLLCWKTLEGSGIDLNAPIRGYENFELVLREKRHRK